MPTENKFLESDKKIKMHQNKEERKSPTASSKLEKSPKSASTKSSTPNLKKASTLPP